MFLSPSGERLGEGAAATARLYDFCMPHFPLTQPLPRSGGEEDEGKRREASRRRVLFRLLDDAVGGASDQFLQMVEFDAETADPLRD